MFEDSDLQALQAEQELILKQEEEMRRVQEAAKSLGKNRNFQILKEYVEKNHLGPIQNHKGTEEGIHNAFADLHFRRGLSLLFDIVKAQQEE